MFYNINNKILRKDLNHGQMLQTRGTDTEFHVTEFHHYYDSVYSTRKTSSVFTDLSVTCEKFMCSRLSVRQQFIFAFTDQLYQRDWLSDRLRKYLTTAIKAWMHSLCYVLCTSSKGEGMLSCTNNT